VTDTQLGLLYVTDAYDGTVTIVNTTTDAVLGSVEVGRYPVPVAFDEQNGQVYVAKYGADNVSVLGPAGIPLQSSGPQGVPPWLWAGILGFGLGAVLTLIVAAVRKGRPGPAARPEPRTPTSEPSSGSPPP
jgi:YVTN family beta-propeller protein